jgi:TfoX/Sxy family transcriptional regulator of competence genes
MPYDQALAGRIRAELTGLPGLEEKKMFGGVGFMLGGNMAFGVHGDDLIVRVGPDEYEASLTQPGARPFDMTGRPMSGWVMVAPAGFRAPSDLKRWIDHGVKYAQSLPPK